MDLIKMRKAASAIYLATNESIADDISEMLKGAANEIEFLRQKNKEAIKRGNEWKLRALDAADEIEEVRRKTGLDEVL
ncbi:MAG: hypothetical protein DRI46_09275 [Chloroflexi bacterium]|nr:MAG: hypothetical protein DRI46_09275 [Chloroflexota bacterium]